MVLLMQLSLEQLNQAVQCSQDILIYEANSTSTQSQNSTPICVNWRSFADYFPYSVACLYGNGHSLR